MTHNLWKTAAAGIFLAFAAAGCRESAPPEQRGRTVIRYWEKWTGAEAGAMRAVVDDFNASQDRIFVDYSPISNTEHKLMLATAGGVPPDVCGVWGLDVPVYAEHNALTPLDRLSAEFGVERARYIDVFWQLCSHRGHLWALPSTPGCNALVWNKKMFRQAGLDPEQPPRSIAELERFNEKLVQYRPDGSIASIGHLPEEPGWWNYLWGCWFGGKPWDGAQTLTIDSPENVAAYEWVESYPKRFGAAKLLALREGFGNFASPGNPFFTGRVAMVLQGPWIYNFIKNFAPADFEWGVAPFPSADPVRLKNVTVVESDVLVIPNKAKHPREAFEFIAYVNSPKPMEKLCLGQRKFTPLRAVSPEFLRDHPNPAIGEFIKLANSSNAVYVPRIPTCLEFISDMKNAVSRIWTGRATAREALRDVRARQQEALDRKMAHWERLSSKLPAEWEKQ
jgi:ABC-type glycerol-3-phosphate transport system substrate-binding protein